VIFGRSELFTEHTTLAVLPVLDGKASVWQLLRLWGLVYPGNLVGVFFIALVVSYVGPQLGVIEPGVLHEVGSHVVEAEGLAMLLSALLAGWLMGLLSWLVTAGRDTTSQILFVWLVTATIGLAGLHHCILGSGEVLAAILAGADISTMAFARFLAITTLGNAIGGVVFVAIVKYAHASVVRSGLREWPPPRG
jgi:formate/nitrite transporter FocA (FNT family)